MSEGDYGGTDPPHPHWVMKKGPSEVTVVPSSRLHQNSDDPSPLSGSRDGPRGVTEVTVISSLSRVMTGCSYFKDRMLS